MKNLKKVIKSLLLLCFAVLLGASEPQSGDYSKSVNHINVDDPSVQFLQNVNLMLCIINNSGYQQTDVSQLYVSQYSSVSSDLCNLSYSSIVGTESAVSNGYKLKYVVHPGTNNGGQQIDFTIISNIGDFAYKPFNTGVLNIFQSPSQSNPYGIFNFSFKSNSGSGYISSNITNLGQAQLVYYLDNVTYGVLLSANESNGYGSVVFGGTQYHIAYDANYLCESSTVDQCYNRRSIASTNVYQYALFNDDGSAVNDPGPLGYDVYSNGTFLGVVDYFAATSNEGGFSNNKSINYRDMTSSGALQSGSIYKASGLMYRYTAESIAFAQLAGVQMDVINNESRSTITWSPNNGGEFLLVSKSNNGGMTETFSPPYPVYDQESMIADNVIKCDNSGQGESGYLLVQPHMVNTQQSRVPVVSNCSITGNNPVSGDYLPPLAGTTFQFWSYNQVQATANQSNQTMYCFLDCAVNESGTKVSPLSGDGSGGSSNDGESIPYITYNFDSGLEYSLKVADSNISYNEKAITSSDVSSGMILYPQDQYNRLIHQDQVQVTTSNSNAVNALLNNGFINQFYTWLTGSNNSTIGIKDSSGNLLPISGPLQLAYSESGTTYSLDYIGNGIIQGLPATCVNIDDGSLATDAANCGSDDTQTTWKRMNIPDRTQVTDLNGKTYWVRPTYTVVTISPLTSTLSFSQNPNSNPDLDNIMAKAMQLPLPEPSGYNINGVIYP